MKLLDENGIEMHAQIVLVKGVNDGEILKKTARVERFILLAVTAAFMIALIVMAIQMF